MMKNTKRAVLTAFGLIPAIAMTSAQYQPVLLSDSRLWVSGTSTVRSFECKATSVDATIEAASPAVSSEVMSGQKAVQTVIIAIPAAKLDCANGTMNEHMFKAIKSKDNPVIEFRLASYDMAKGADAMNGKLTGTLSLGGVQKEITIDAAATALPNGALRVVGAEELLLSDYGLKAPSLMMGAMKVGNKVTVRFDLQLK
jgi:polyisoprenoid-binding protein YceI